MDKLRSQHRAVISGVVFSIGAWYWYLYYTYGGKMSEVKEFLPLIGVTLPVLAGAVIFIYEKIGWKVINPAYDFGGDWHFIGTQFSVQPDTREYCEAYDVWGEMRIEQDLSRMEISSGETYRYGEKDAPHLGTWRSISLDTDPSGTQFVTVLDHQMNPARQTGNVKYAVEVFTVTKWSEGRFGRERPIEMSSEVFHCVERASVPHRMTGHYVRLPAPGPERVRCSESHKRLLAQRHKALATTAVCTSEHALAKPVSVAERPQTSNRVPKGLRPSRCKAAAHLTKALPVP